MIKLVRSLIALAFAFCIDPTVAAAQDNLPCWRAAAGSAATQPPDLYGQGGVLNVAFNYYTSLDAAGRTLFCFITPDGQELPTLPLQPGDILNLVVTNMNPRRRHRQPRPS